MAITQNTYTGDGATVLFSFTFPYIAESDIKISLDGTLTTAYTLANATTIQFNTAPANGVEIRIYRDTNVDNLSSTFFPGSAIKAEDLNNNFTQNNYSAQESKALSSQAPTALANSLAAINTANQAASDASTALTAASNAVAYSPVADVASIPVSPTDGDYIEVLDGTGIESFTPLAGLPVGFVGDSGLSIRLNYTSAGSTWNWVDYIANDADTRYIKSTDIGVTVQAYDATILNSSDIDVTVQSYDADTVKQDVLPTFTVATRTTERTITAGSFDLSTGNLWTVGAITVPNPTNAVSGQTGAIRITAGPVVWSSNFKFPGGSAPTIGTFPAIIPYYVQDSSNILMGNVTEGIA